MEALLGDQKPQIQGHLRPLGLTHSRRARRGHRGMPSQFHAEWRYDIFLKSGQAQVLGGTQVPIHILSSRTRPLTNLEELKARRFTAIGRDERMARSLAALSEPGAIHLTQADWQWLDENFAIEEEFE